MKPCTSGVRTGAYMLDITAETKPMVVSVFQVPVGNFCDKRGRFGPHNPPHLKAPGRPHPNFTAYTFFNAGLQFYDIKDPAKPQNNGYFIPPQAGGLDDYLSYPRDTDNVFIEWDRKLMWVGTGTGIYLVTSPLLGEPVLERMPVKEWALAGLNVGHA
jgi:hypothetical protein